MASLGRGQAPEHVYISNDPITVGSMGHVDKFKYFSALCVALAAEQESNHPCVLRSHDLIVRRKDLSVKQHWGLLVKPKCALCELRQAILRANVPKAERLTFDRDQFRALMARIESEAHL